MRLAPLGLALAGLLLFVACSTDEAETATDAPEEEPAAVVAQRPDLVPLIKGPLSADGLQAIFGTSDLGVGINRVGFVLTSATGLVTEPSASISSYFSPEDGSLGQPVETASAVFRPWPYGSRGLYTTSLTFDREGEWGIDIAVKDPDGLVKKAQLFFDVQKSPSAPAVGSPALKSQTKTIDDVESLAQISTGSLQDADLYETTLAIAIESGMPVVVVFASPAFCINAVCGPQVEVLQQLKDKYKGRARFIHVDFYDNPQGIQGDLTKARLSPAVLEWNLPSTEWSFVIDRRGIVAARFEAFATFEELEEALVPLL